MKLKVLSILLLAILWGCKEVEDNAHIDAESTGSVENEATSERTRTQKGSSSSLPSSANRISKEDLEADPSERLAWDTHRLFNFVRHAPLEECDLLLRDFPISKKYEDLLSILARRYGDEDPSIAAEWLLSLDEEASSRAAFVKIGLMLGGDPNFITEVIPEIGDSGLKLKFLHGALRSYGKNDLSGAVNLAQQFSDKYELDETELLDSALGGGIESKKLAKVLETIETDSPGADMSYGLKRNIVRRVADIDPEMAASWLSQQESSDETNQLLGEVVGSSLGKSDPLAAANWIGSLEDQSLRDHAIVGFSYSILKLQPVGAYEWAASISDPNMRTKTINRLLAETTISKDKIRGFLNDSALPKSELDSYLLKLDR